MGLSASANVVAETRNPNETILETGFERPNRNFVVCWNCTVVINLISDDNGSPMRVEVNTMGYIFKSPCLF